MLAFADEEKSITLAFEQLENNSNDNDTNSTKCLNKNNLYHSQSSNNQNKKISCDKNNNNESKNKNDLNLNKNLINENIVKTINNNQNDLDHIKNNFEKIAIENQTEISMIEVNDNNFININELTYENSQKVASSIISETLNTNLEKKLKDSNKKTNNSNDITNILTTAKTKNLTVTDLALPKINKQKTMLSECFSESIKNEQLDENNDLTNNCIDTLKTALSIDKINLNDITSIVDKKINSDNSLNLSVEKIKFDESKPNSIIIKKLDKISTTSTRTSSVLTKPLKTRIASKLTPVSSLSSTLPRKKVLTSAKNEPTSLSVFASTENISKENKTIIKPIANSTINLTTTMTSSTTKELSKPPPTYALKKTLETLPQHTDINLSTNNIMKTSVIKSREEKQLPVNKPILQSKIGTNKPATNINRLPTTASSLRILTKNNQKKLTSKSINNTKSVESPIKASILKSNQITTNLLNTDKKISTLNSTNKQNLKIIESNTNIRSVRGTSSVPRITSTKMTSIITAKKITNPAKRAVSTVNLNATLKNETLIQKSQTFLTNSESINKMCRILKNKMPEIKINANNLNNLCAELSTGVLLCRFINKIQPRLIPTILLSQPSQDVIYFLIFLI